LSTADLQKNKNSETPRTKKIEIAIPETIGSPILAAGKYSSTL